MEPKESIWSKAWSHAVLTGVGIIVTALLSSWSSEREEGELKSSFAQQSAEAAQKMTALIIEASIVSSSLITGTLTSSDGSTNALLLTRV